MTETRTPRPGQIFRAAGQLFLRTPLAEERDFGGSIGRCLRARRVETRGPDEGDGTPDARPVGEEEWVRTESVEHVFESLTDLFAELWPTVYAGRSRGEK